MRRAFDAVDSGLIEFYGYMLTVLASEGGPAVRQHTLDTLGIMSLVSRHELDGVAGRNPYESWLENHHSFSALVQHFDFHFGRIGTTGNHHSRGKCRRQKPAHPDLLLIDRGAQSNPMRVF
jgi:hypothetical protein